MALVIGPPTSLRPDTHRCSRFLTLSLVHAKEFARDCQREISDRPTGSRIKLRCCYQAAMTTVVLPAAVRFTAGPGSNPSPPAVSPRTSVPANGRQPSGRMGPLSCSTRRRIFSGLSIRGSFIRRWITQHAPITVLMRRVRADVEAMLSPDNSREITEGSIFPDAQR
jgi:hypothetical protein